MEPVIRILQPKDLSSRLGSWLFPGVAALAMFAPPLVTPAAADSSWVTLADLKDAILDRGSYTPQQLADLDVNKDGVLDVRDVVCFHNNCHKGARFFATSSAVTENGGVVNVRVDFDLPFTGTLAYAVSPESTATSGQDFAALSGALPVAAATQVNIPVTILNDATVGEEQDFLILRLSSGPGYNTFAPLEHTVTIVDDDATWYGSLERANGSVAFTLALAESGGGLVAGVTSDGHGTFPDPAPASSFPAVPAPTVTTSLFAATFPGIPVAAADTLFNASMTRTLVLSADEAARPPATQAWAAITNYAVGNRRRPTSENGLTYEVTVGGLSSISEPAWPTVVDATVVDGAVTWKAVDADRVEVDLVRGNFTETIVPVDSGQAHLGRSLTGRFTLVRELPRGSSYDPAPTNPALVGRTVEVGR